MVDTKTDPIFMEQDEYLEYLKNQIKSNPEVAHAPIAQISMYQMNKDLVAGLKKMNNMAVNKALENVKTWYMQQPEKKHFALLNHDKHYFTIFEQETGDATEFIAALKDILMAYYGDNDIRAIDVKEGAVEIWAMWDGEATVAYLFPYEQGVVYF